MTDSVVEKILGTAAATASAAINIDGIKDAAQANLTGVREGLALQRDIFDTVREGQEPFIDAGVRSISDVDAAARNAIDTGAQNVAAALPTATGVTTPADRAVNQAVNIVNAANIDNPLPSAGRVSPVTTAANVNQGPNPLDPNSPLTQGLIDETLRRLNDRLAVEGKFGTEDEAGVRGSERRDETAKAIVNEVIRNAQNIQSVNASRAQTQLAAEGQEFGQNAQAITANFSNDLATRQQEFSELVTGGNMTFEQQLAFRQQLSREDQALFDRAVQANEVQFQQDQQVFENIFNIDAQNFQQSLGLDNQQFQQLVEIFRTGANVSVGAGSNAAQFAAAQAELIGGGAAISGAESIARGNAIGGALGSIVEILTA